MRPRRGRVAYGTVRDLAYTLGIHDQILYAGSREAAEKLFAIPIHKGELGGYAGRCFGFRGRYAPCGLIELHKALFVPGREQDLKDTLLHELGHALDNIRRGKSDHSSEWKRAMADLGAPGEERCHSYAYITSRRGRR